MMLSLKESVDFGTVFYSRASNGGLSDPSCDGEPRLREAAEATATRCPGAGQSRDVPSVDTPPTHGCNISMSMEGDSRLEPTWT